MLPRNFIEIIIKKCPAYASPLPDCPLASLRINEGTGVAREKMEAMSDEEIDALIRKHFLCVCRKEGCGT